MEPEISLPYSQAPATAVHVADNLNSDARISFWIDTIKTCEQNLWLVYRPTYHFKILGYLHLHTSSSYLASTSDVICLK